MPFLDYERQKKNVVKAVTDSFLDLTPVTRTEGLIVAKEISVIEK